MSTGELLGLLSLLFMAGVAMRMTLLTVPPVIPLMHEDLRMSETQVGLLIGLPLAVFAIAAVPGSLLIARIGTSLAVVVGLLIAALAGGARAAANDVWMLYAFTIVTGFGIAIMQPGMPTLVREWVPHRIALGTVAYSCGMLIGATLPAGLTIPLVLPLVGGGWRHDLVFWAVPAVLMAVALFLLRPKETPRGQGRASGDPAQAGRWWPDWKNPLIWLLGFTFGSNNTPYFVTSAFLGDYLDSLGKGHLLASALGWLNGSQVIALLLLLLIADRLQRRAWPFLVFGPILVVAFLMMIIFPTEWIILIACVLVGFTSAVTMTAILALPALLSAPGDVARTAAGMFTISYTCAVIIPTICGALWDLTGKPWTAFAPLCLCGVTLAWFGAIAARHRPAAEQRPGR